MVGETDGDRVGTQRKVNCRGPLYMGRARRWENRSCLLEGVEGLSAQLSLQILKRGLKRCELDMELVPQGSGDQQDKKGLPGETGLSSLPLRGNVGNNNASAACPFPNLVG